MSTITRQALALRALYLALPVAFACREPSDRIRTMPDDGADVPILNQVQGTHCHEPRPLRLVIRDAAMLAQVPIADVPVDFETQMLLVITLGRVTSDRFDVRIDRVWRERGRLKVSYSVDAPAEAPLAMASPYCIAVIPRCDLNVEGFSAAPPVRERSWEQSTLPEEWGKP